MSQTNDISRPFEAVDRISDLKTKTQMLEAKVQHAEKALASSKQSALEAQASNEKLRYEKEWLQNERDVLSAESKTFRQETRTTYQFISRIKIDKLEKQLYVSQNELWATKERAEQLSLVLQQSNQERHK